MSLPEQYRTGKAYFMDFQLKVTKDTLIPRPETEILVEKAIEYIKAKHNDRSVTICDIGTGSGNIAVSLGYYLENVRITALDISKEALLIAEENAKSIKVEKKISFIHSDIFQGIDKVSKFDLIVSNPPYVAENHAHLLPPEVQAEPKIALFAGKHGMDVYDRIAVEAKVLLKKDGAIMMEIGFDQKERMQILLQDNGYKDIVFYKDYSGIDRIVKAENG